MDKLLNPSTVKPLNHFLLKKVAFILAEVFSPHFAGSRKHAFTLAEVLITLGIIGVVAAMTLPTLIAQNQKKTAITQLKKAYSEFAQAVTMAQVDNGMMDSWDFSAFNTWNVEDADVANQTKLDRMAFFGEKYLFPYIKVLKKCVPSTNECWADTVYSLSGAVATEVANTGTSASFVSPSGYSVYYWLHGNETEGGTGGHFIIDVNGLKGPNTYGKDVFRFAMNWGSTTNKRGFYPFGLHTWETLSREELISDSLSGCKKTGGGYIGGYCAALLVTDNWDLKEDYPW